MLTIHKTIFSCAVFHSMAGSTREHFCLAIYCTQSFTFCLTGLVFRNYSMSGQVSKTKLLRITGAGF